MCIFLVEGHELRILCMLKLCFERAMYLFMEIPNNQHSSVHFIGEQNDAKGMVKLTACELFA